MDAYRRNVQLKRRCSGLESRGRQLNRKITHPGLEPVRLSPIKRMQIRRETCPVIEVIIVSRSPRACHRVLFSLSLFASERRDFFSFPSKEPKRPRHSFSSLVNARIQLLSFTIYNRGRTILSLSLSLWKIVSRQFLLRDYPRMFTPRFDKRPDIALRAW